MISLTIMNLVTPEVGAKHEILFNEPASDARGWFVEQKFMFSSNFRGYQIQNCFSYDFGHTLL
jgi:hypothetical protein